jgi:uncharacterized protein YdaU (DUF1376 family)
MSRPDIDPLPFISYSVAHWLSDTTDLAPEHYRTLHRLMAHAWLRGSRVPNSIPRLASLAGITSQEFERIWPEISDWFRPDGDGLVMLTIADTYQRAALGREKHRRGAATTNRKRWDGNSESLSDPLSNTNIDTLSDSLNTPDSDSPPPPPPSPSPNSHTRSLEGDARGNLCASETFPGVSREKETGAEPTAAKPNGSDKPNRCVNRLLKNAAHEAQFDIAF